MNKQSGTSQLPLVILAVLALAFVPLLLSLRQKMTQPKAQTCTSSECSTATGCQLQGYLMNVNGVDYTCAGNNEWTDPNGNKYPGSPEGPVVQVIPQEPGTEAPVEEIIVAKKGDVEITTRAVTGDRPETQTFTYKNISTGETKEIPESFPTTLFTQVYPRADGRYVAVTQSNSSQRDISVQKLTSVYDMNSLEKVAERVCLVAEPHFWNDSLIYTNCDETPSAAALNLSDLTDTVLTPGVAKDIIDDNVIVEIDGIEKNVNLSERL